MRFIICLLVFIAGCGGGGGTTNVPTTPIASVPAYDITTTGYYTAPGALVVVYGGVVAPDGTVVEVNLVSIKHGTLYAKTATVEYEWFSVAQLVPESDGYIPVVEIGSTKVLMAVIPAPETGPVVLLNQTFAGVERTAQEGDDIVALQGEMIVYSPVQFSTVVAEKEGDFGHPRLRFNYGEEVEGQVVGETVAFFGNPQSLYSFVYPEYWAIEVFATMTSGGRLTLQGAGLDFYYANTDIPVPLMKVQGAITGNRYRR